MSALELFTFEAHEIRVVLLDGEPWWVASDLAKALGYRDAASATRILRDRTKGTHSVSTLGGPQPMAIVSEPGLYRLVMRSHRPDAERFQDWVTDEVLPSIRKTGAYAPPPAARPSHVEALRAWADEVEVRELAEAQVLELQLVAKVNDPQARAWVDLASADGDYSVSDAAKLLERGGVKMGRGRLFAELLRLNMVYTEGSGRRLSYHPYQRQVDAGRLVMRLGGSYSHPKTGKAKVGPGTVRVTTKGVGYLREQLLVDLNSKRVVTQPQPPADL